MAASQLVEPKFELIVGFGSLEQMRDLRALNVTVLVTVAHEARAPNDLYVFFTLLAFFVMFLCILFQRRTACLSDDVVLRSGLLLRAETRRFKALRIDKNSVEWVFSSMGNLGSKWVVFSAVGKFSEAQAWLLIFHL